MQTDHNATTPAITAAHMTTRQTQAWPAFVLAALATLGACEPTSSTDREKGLRELRAIEAENARNAPPIPQSARVGCDVCPHWCQYADLHRVPLDELFQGYREDARRAYDLENARTGYDPPEPITHADRYEMAEARDRLHRISCIAKRSGPEAIEAFLSYLDDESPIVQVATADVALARGLARERAYAALDRIQHSGRRWPHTPAFTASVLLRKWRYEHDPRRHARQALPDSSEDKPAPRPADASAR